MAIYSVKIIDGNTPITFNELKQLVQTGPVYVKATSLDSSHSNIFLWRILDLHEDTNPLEIEIFDGRNVETITVNDANTPFEPEVIFNGDNNQEQ